LQARGCSDIERRGAVFAVGSWWAAQADIRRRPVARPSSSDPDAKAPSRTGSTEAYVNILERLIEQFVEAKPLLAVGKRIGRELVALGMKHDD